MKKLIKLVIVCALFINGLQAVKSVYAVQNFEAANIQKINEALK